LETDGELGAAELISLLADPNAARELTYRLYSVCERKGWALEGQAYNALAISWLEILERAEAQSGPPAQQSLEV